MFSLAGGSAYRRCGPAARSSFEVREHPPVTAQVTFSLDTIDAALGQRIFGLMLR
jgi:hypothetical protein